VSLVLSELEPELELLELLELELLELELESVPSGTGPLLSVVMSGPEVLSVAGGLVSVGSGLGPVVSGVGGMLVSLPVVVEVVLFLGTSHSPMHTGSAGTPQAGTEDERRRSGPRAAIALRFICTNLVRPHASALARAKARSPGVVSQSRMISSPSPISTPNGDVVTSVPRSPT